MAKKIKFPLTMKNNFQVRTIEELREHFDLDKAIEYFLDGKLLAWLEARYYEQESVAIRELGKDEAQLHQKLCNILGVEYDEAETEDIDLEAVAERNRKLSELKQYTSDLAILDKVNQVAFNQEDLADLLDEGIHDIYLCNNSFAIPLRITNRHYIGIGKAEAVIRSSERVDFDAKGIAFENVHFDSAYEKLNNETPEQLYQKGMAAQNRKDYTTALDYYRRVADAGNSDGYFKLGWFYGNGLGVNQDYSVSYQYYMKAADMGDTWAMYNIGVYYENGWGETQNYPEAFQWYLKSANAENPEAMCKIGKIFYNIGSSQTERSIWHFDLSPEQQESYRIQGVNWYTKAIQAGNIQAMYELAVLYDIDSDPLIIFRYNMTEADWIRKGKSFSKAKMWYEEAAKRGNIDAMRKLFDKRTEEIWKRYITNEECLKWGMMAIDAGCEDLTFDVGCIYVKKGEFSRALDFYKRAYTYAESKGHNLEYIENQIRFVKSMIT